MAEVLLMCENKGRRPTGGDACLKWINEQCSPAEDHENELIMSETNNALVYLFFLYCHHCDIFAECLTGKKFRSIKIYGLLTEDTTDYVLSLSEQWKYKQVSLSRHGGKSSLLSPEPFNKQLEFHSLYNWRHFFSVEWSFLNLTPRTSCCFQAF